MAHYILSGGKMGGKRNESTPVGLWVRIVLNQRMEFRDMCVRPFQVSPETAECAKKANEEV